MLSGPTRGHRRIKMHSALVLVDYPVECIASKHIVDTKNAVQTLGTLLLLRQFALLLQYLPCPPMCHFTDVKTVCCQHEKTPAQRKSVSNQKRFMCYCAR